MLNRKKKIEVPEQLTIPPMPAAVPKKKTNAQWLAGELLKTSVDGTKMIKCWNPLAGPDVCCEYSDCYVCKSAWLRREHEERDTK